MRNGILIGFVLVVLVGFFLFLTPNMNAMIYAGSPIMEDDSKDDCRGYYGDEPGCPAFESASPECYDGIQNYSETDVDCGGGVCRVCPVGKKCLQGSDCSANLCEAGVCSELATCGNMIQDGDETDVDCGGSGCNVCSVGKNCVLGSDCSTNFCKDGICSKEVTCSDGIMNQDETGIDCGGVCPPCSVTCTDSDGGRDEFVKGTVYGAGLFEVEKDFVKGSAFTVAGQGDYDDQILNVEIVDIVDAQGGNYAVVTQLSDFQGGVIDQQTNTEMTEIVFEDALGNNPVFGKLLVNSVVASAGPGQQNDYFKGDSAKVVGKGRTYLNQMLKVKVVDFVAMDGFIYVVAELSEYSGVVIDSQNGKAFEYIVFEDVLGDEVINEEIYVKDVVEEGDPFAVLIIGRQLESAANISVEITGVGEKEDYCASSFVLKEFYCSNEGINFIEEEISCSNGCFAGACISEEAQNSKNTWGNIKKVFIISDSSQNDVLSLVPVTTWTDSAGVDCFHGYGTADNVCAYPTLIFHEEDDSFDADSIIYFLQQFEPDQVTLVGETPQELDNLLVASAPHGAGVSVDRISRIYPENYLSFWSNYSQVVFVEDNYELGLVAASYASLHNAPLIVQNSLLDVPENYAGKNIICVGNAVPQGASCGNEYSLNELQQAIVSETGTDKMILVNPDDISMGMNESFTPEKSSNSISTLYSKTSLAAPFLAGAKHEVIIPVSSSDYETIDSTLESRVNSLFPGLVNNSSGIKKTVHEVLGKYVMKKNISTGSTKTTVKYKGSNFPQYLLISGDIDKFISYNYLPAGSEELNYYDLGAETMQVFDEYLGNDYPDVFGFAGDKIFFVQSDIDKFYLLDPKTGIKEEVYQNETFLNGESTWPAANESKIVTSICYKDGCKIEMIDIEEKTKQTIKEADGYDLGINGDYVYWTEGGSDLYIYQISTGSTEERLDFAQKQNDAIYVIGYSDLFVVFSDVVYKQEYQSIYLYDIANQTKQLLTDKAAPEYSAYPRAVFENDMVVWLEDDQNVCTESGETCASSSDCSAGVCMPSEINVYNVSTKTLKEFADKDIVLGYPEITNDSVVFTGNVLNNYDYYINGYLTVIGAPNVIPHETFMYEASGHPISRALDVTEYADFYKDDLFPDMAVGRIQGLTLSDVSSYIARALTYDQTSLQKNNMKFMAAANPDMSAYYYVVQLAEEWTNIFSSRGYNAQSDLHDDYAYDFDPAEWENQGMISYQDHGGGKWAGIYYYEIPWIPNSMVFLDACSTCAAYDSRSFCTNVIRKGGIGTTTAASVAFVSNKIHKKTMDGIFYEKLDLGNSFVKNYPDHCSYGYKYQYMTQLLGDPTMDLNPLHYLSEELPWHYPAN